MKIVLGCDEAGYQMKQQILHHIKQLSGWEIEDIGCYDENPVFYADIAQKASEQIQAGQADRAILICGTGIGVAISANKAKGIRAAVCHDLFSTERSILSNNAQVMCLGARVIAVPAAWLLIRRWLELKFQGGPSEEKITRIAELESKIDGRRLI